ncbi:curlin repeat-containing protein [Pseudomonas sp. UBA4102]
MFIFKPLAAAVLAVLATQAFAENNTARQDQHGVLNTATIEQSGSGNAAK